MKRRRVLLNRISICGPESSGKSWLSSKLADHYDTCLVEEYSRKYLVGKGSYNKDDILKIAKGQLKEEEEIAKSCNSVLFCDTDLLVNKIWSQYVFGEADKWIEDNFIKHEYGLYLLCSPDIEWENDPLRENPDNRDLLFGLYEVELKVAKFNYKIVSGQGNKRMQNAVKFVDEFLKIQKGLNARR